MCLNDHPVPDYWKKLMLQQSTRKVTNVIVANTEGYISLFDLKSRT